MFSYQSGHPNGYVIFYNGERVGVVGRVRGGWMATIVPSPRDPAAQVKAKTRQEAVKIAWDKYLLKKGDE